MKIEQYWGIIYAIMKSLGVKELEIDKKYFEIDINKFVNMYYHDTLNGNIKVELREKNNEVETTEEKKIPEKINIYNYDEPDIMCKVNEIIDYLEYLKSKGDE